MAGPQSVLDKEWPPLVQTMQPRPIQPWPTPPTKPANTICFQEISNVLYPAFEGPQTADCPSKPSLSAEGSSPTKPFTSPDPLSPPQSSSTDETPSPPELPSTPEASTRKSPSSPESSKTSVLDDSPWYPTTPSRALIQHPRPPTPPSSTEEPHLKGYQRIPQLFYYITSRATHALQVPTILAPDPSPQPKRKPSNPYQSLQTSLIAERFTNHWSNKSPITSPTSTLLPLYATYAAALCCAREIWNHLNESSPPHDSHVQIHSLSTGCLNWSTISSSADPAIKLQVLVTIPYMGLGETAIIPASEALKMVCESVQDVDTKEWYALGRIPESMFETEVVCLRSRWVQKTKEGTAHGGEILAQVAEEFDIDCVVRGKFGELTTKPSSAALLREEED